MEKAVNIPQDHPLWKSKFFQQGRWLYQNKKVRSIAQNQDYSKDIPNTHQLKLIPDPKRTEKNGSKSLYKNE